MDEFVMREGCGSREEDASAPAGYQVPTRHELTEWRLPKQLQDEYVNAEQQAPGLLLCTQFASHLRGRVQYVCAE